MNRKLIDDYAAGADKLSGSIAGLTRAQLAAFPVPGTWSIGQIVVHLMDSDLIASDRMKRVAAEDNPSLIGFDETAFARKLFYNDLDPLMAADVFRQNRLLTTEVLRRLPDDAFTRHGTHNERGQMTLEDLLTTYVGHLEHHLKFIHEKRQMVTG